MSIIDQQSIQIIELQTQVDLLHNEVFELRKGKDSQEVISELMARIDVQAERIAELEAQVAALKEIAIKGVAQMLIAEGAEMCIVPDSVYSEADCYCVDDVMQCPARDYVLSEARRQLSEEHPEVDWK